MVLAVGGLLLAILGLFAYVSFTATPLHPNAQDVPSVASADPSKRWADAVQEGQRLVRADLTEQNLPGLSVAVGVDGDIVWAEGFGWANLENRTRVEPDTRFRIGGASMALTSAAVGLLLEKDRLKLDDEIQTYVTAFPKKQWPVTLRQLMGHVAGVRNDAGDEEPLSERCERTVDGLKRFADSPLRFEPGTQFRYSTYGWILVSAAVEAAADEPFFTFMRTQIFEPLDMDDTRADVATDPIPDRATFYHPRFAADTTYGPELAREGDYSCFAGAGGFLSTPSDLVRFGMAITNGKLLQPATVKLLQTPPRLASGEESGYALGWDLETVQLAGESTRMAGHDGEFVLGGSTSLMTFPERGLVVAVTTNTSFADTAAIALKIAQAFAERAGSPLRK
ncbi:MAG TPA: serine hydrolase domain-containing protein [Vicinamibacterales bacterium]|nr:serine hydrolase domain-containing protein [Vicinamibacterales bacterium]